MRAIKITRLQVRAFEVDPSLYPEGFTIKQMMKVEEQNASDDPELYFDGAKEFIEAEELKDMSKSTGDTITFNLRGSE